MQEIHFEKPSELRKNLKNLESKLKVKIKLKGNLATIDGSSLDEYEASIVLDAISFGFSARKALQLQDPEIIFRKIHIKDFTRRKNLREVKARFIGTKGKTKKTIEQISDCSIILNDNEIGVIGSAESIEKTTTAITNLIKGSKQSNVYRFLEKINKSKKDLEPLD